MGEMRKEKMLRNQEEMRDLLEDLLTRIEEIRKELVIELEDMEEMITEAL